MKKKKIQKIIKRKKNLNKIKEMRLRKKLKKKYLFILLEIMMKMFHLILNQIKVNSHQIQKYYQKVIFQSTILIINIQYIDLKYLILSQKIR